MARFAPVLRPLQQLGTSAGCDPVRELCHVHRSEGSDRRGLKSVEDRVSTDVRDIVQASESDLIARGVAVDLLQMAKRVGPQYEAAEHENLSREIGFSSDSVTMDDRRGHQTFR